MLRGDMSRIPRIGLEVVDVRDLVDIHLRAMTVTGRRRPAVPRHRRASCGWPTSPVPCAIASGPTPPGPDEDGPRRRRARCSPAVGPSCAGSCPASGDATGTARPRPRRSSGGGRVRAPTPSSTAGAASSSTGWSDGTPAGRRPQPRAARRAAREVFAERGLGATLDDVAAAAGVGTGTAYRHFRNKHELAAEVLARRDAADRHRRRRRPGDRRPVAGARRLLRDDGRPPGRPTAASTRRWPARAARTTRCGSGRRSSSR